MSTNSPITRVASVLRIPEAFVVELVEAGVVELGADEVHFEHTVERVRISWCLREDLGVNLAGIEVALHLLSIIDRDRRHFSRRP
ncbi:MAG: hypothetical protein EP330_06840 [Deltaproteobacteria bacterium]|nr:MAG: hypothetical protein EP330_06840 [Deltaproteobacteria bacterium]